MEFIYNFSNGKKNFIGNFPIINKEKTICLDLDTYKSISYNIKEDCICDNSIGYFSSNQLDTNKDYKSVKYKCLNGEELDCYELQDTYNPPIFYGSPVTSDLTPFFDKKSEKIFFRSQFSEGGNIGRVDTVSGLIEILPIYTMYGFSYDKNNRRIYFHNRSSYFRYDIDDSGNLINMISRSGASGYDEVNIFIDEYNWFVVSSTNSVKIFDENLNLLYVLNGLGATQPGHALQYNKEYDRLYIIEGDSNYDLLQLKWGYWDISTISTNPNIIKTTPISPPSNLAWASGFYVYPNINRACIISGSFIGAQKQAWWVDLTTGEFLYRLTPYGYGFSIVSTIYLSKDPIRILIPNGNSFRIVDPINKKYKEYYPINYGLINGTALIVKDKLIVFPTIGNTTSDINNGILVISDWMDTPNDFDYI